MGLGASLIFSEISPIRWRRVEALRMVLAATPRLMAGIGLSAESHSITRNFRTFLRGVRKRGLRKSLTRPRMATR